MKKRIFVGFFILNAISTVLCAAALCGVFYAQFSGEAHQEVYMRAMLLQQAGVDTLEESSMLAVQDMRITLVAADGVVVYDSESDAAEMDNHAQREEIHEALVLGVGESKRFSNTAQMETFYYAVRLENGSVLRLAQTGQSVWGWYTRALPYVIGVLVLLLLLSWWLAEWLTARTLRPLNRINPDALDADIRLLGIYDEMVPFVRTILRQREHINQQLEDAKFRAETVNAILDNMREGIALLDRQGHILRINGSALTIFEASAEMVGKHIVELLRDVGIMTHIQWALLEGRASETEYRCGERYYQVFCSPVAEENGAIILFLDVTERTQAERMRQEFSANVSHELKTPLTSIAGYAEMLTSGMVQDGDITVVAGKIQDEAQRLTILVEDVLMLSALDEAQVVVHEPVDMAVLATEVAQALSLKAAQADVTLQVETSKAAIVNGNRTQLSELLFNLMDNGIKYNHSGGSVTVTVEQRDGQILLRVEDTGIGIPQEHQERVFERFYRVDGSRSKKTGGTGLGLSIVKRVALAHNGCVELQSAEGRGTVVMVQLVEIKDM